MGLGSGVRVGWKGIGAAQERALPYPFSTAGVQGMLPLTWHPPSTHGTLLGCLSSLLRPASSHLLSASTRNFWWEGLCWAGKQGPVAHGYSSVSSFPLVCWGLTWVNHTQGSGRPRAAVHHVLQDLCCWGRALGTVGMRKENTAQPRHSWFRKDPVLPVPQQKLKTQSFWEGREFLLRRLHSLKRLEQKWPWGETALSLEK